MVDLSISLDAFEAHFALKMTVWQAALFNIF
jgi:hypothetical protein